MTDSTGPTGTISSGSSSLGVTDLVKVNCFDPVHLGWILMKFQTISVWWLFLKQEGLDYIFCGIKKGPFTDKNSLFPPSNIKKRQGDFWRSCSMLEEHEERVIQCSCIFAFHSFIARRHDQFLLSTVNTSSITTITHIVWCCSLFYGLTFHALLIPCLHRALSCKSTFFIDFGHRTINLCIAEQRASE